MTATDLVPAENMAVLEALDPAAREVAVTRMLDEARGWLAHAVEATQPQAVAEFKVMMATVSDWTQRLNLSKDIQLDAAEMARRAERGLGLAIRKGQDAGEITKPYDNLRHGQGAVDKSSLPPSPTDFVPSHELSANGAGIYHLTDGVTDEQFDEAITEAKAEGNLSRANVVRKVKPDTPKPTGGDRPEVLRKTRRIDSERVIGSAIADAGLPPRSVFDEVDYTALPDQRLGEWVHSLTSHITDLRSLRTRLMKEMDRRASA